MRKIIASILALTLTASMFTACGDSDSSSKSESSKAATTTTAATTEAPEDENGVEINTTEAAADAAEISEVTEAETSEETNTETDLETPPMPTDLSVAEGNDIPDAPLLQ